MIQRPRDRVIVFRSVDRFANAPLWKSLFEFGYLLLFSRQAYYARPENAMHRKDYGNDQRLLHRTPYEAFDNEKLDATDMARIRSLYYQLYLNKYSRFNPQFTEAFLESAF